jgi:protein-S-isoprenylcysteine O-methyltransferase Ste14
VKPCSYNSGRHRRAFTPDGARRRVTKIPPRPMDQRHAADAEAEKPREAAVSPPSAAVYLFAWGGAVLFVVSLTFFLYAYLVRFGAASGGGGFRAAAIDLAFFSAFALHHSAFARASLKEWVRSTAPPVVERSLYTWIASLLFIAVCWWWQPVGGVFYTLDAPWRWLAAAVQLAGLVVTVSGARALDVLDLAGVRQVLQARTAHVPLTTSGVYRVVRHPLYFGWALFVFATFDMTATRAVFAVVSTGYLAVAIPWEERSLVATFGADYEAYRRKVRWRMIPGLY